MATLFVITMITTSVGGLSGLVSGGYDGLFLGSSAGLVAGVAAWAVLIMVMQWRRERRLDQYFMQSGSVARHTEQDTR